MTSVYSSGPGGAPRPPPGIKMMVKGPPVGPGGGGPLPPPAGLAVGKTGAPPGAMQMRPMGMNAQLFREGMPPSMRGSSPGAPGVGSSRPPGGAPPMPIAGKGMAATPPRGAMLMKKMIAPPGSGPRPGGLSPARGRGSPSASSLPQPPSGSILVPTGGPGSVSAPRVSPLASRPVSPQTLGSARGGSPQGFPGRPPAPSMNGKLITKKMMVGPPGLGGGGGGPGPASVMGGVSPRRAPPPLNDRTGSGRGAGSTSPRPQSGSPAGRNRSGSPDSSRRPRSPMVPFSPMGLLSAKKMPVPAPGGSNGPQPPASMMNGKKVMIMAGAGRSPPRPLSPSTNSFMAKKMMVAPAPGGMAVPPGVPPGAKVMKKMMMRPPQTAAAQPSSGGPSLAMPRDPRQLSPPRANSPSLMSLQTGEAGPSGAARDGRRGPLPPGIPPGATVVKLAMKAPPALAGASKKKMMVKVPVGAPAPGSSLASPPAASGPSAVGRAGSETESLLRVPGETILREDAPEAGLTRPPEQPASPQAAGRKRAKKLRPAVAGRFANIALSDSDEDSDDDSDGADGGDAGEAADQQRGEAQEEPADAEPVSPVDVSPPTPATLSPSAAAADGGDDGDDGDDAALPVQDADDSAEVAAVGTPTATTGVAASPPPRPPPSPQSPTSVEPTLAHGTQQHQQSPRQSRQAASRKTPKAATLPMPSSTVASRLRQKQQQEKEQSQKAEKERKQHEQERRKQQRAASRKSNAARRTSGSTNPLPSKGAAASKKARASSLSTLTGRMSSDASSVHSSAHSGSLNLSASATASVAASDDGDAHRVHAATASHTSSPDSVTRPAGHRSPVHRHTHTPAEQSAHGRRGKRRNSTRSQRSRRASSPGSSPAGSSSPSSDGRSVRGADMYRLYNLLRKEQEKEEVGSAQRRRRRGGSRGGSRDDAWDRRSYSPFHVRLHSSRLLADEAAERAASAARVRQRGPATLGSPGIPWRHAGRASGREPFEPAAPLAQPLGYINVGGGRYACVGNSPYAQTPRRRRRGEWQWQGRAAGGVDASVAEPASHSPLAEVDERAREVVDAVQRDPLYLCSPHRRSPQAARARSQSAPTANVARARERGSVIDASSDDGRRSGSARAHPYQLTQPPPYVQLSAGAVPFRGAISSAAEEAEAMAAAVAAARALDEPTPAEQAAASAMVKGASKALDAYLQQKQQQQQQHSVAQDSTYNSADSGLREARASAARLLSASPTFFDQLHGTQRQSAGAGSRPHPLFANLSSDIDDGIVRTPRGSRGPADSRLRASPPGAGAVLLSPPRLEDADGAAGRARSPFNRLTEFPADDPERTHSGEVRARASPVPSSLGGRSSKPSALRAEAQRQALGDGDMQRTSRPHSPAVPPGAFPASLIPHAQSDKSRTRHSHHNDSRTGSSSSSGSGSGSRNRNSIPHRQATSRQSAESAGHCSRGRERHRDVGAAVAPLPSPLPIPSSGRGAAAGRPQQRRPPSRASSAPRAFTRATANRLSRSNPSPRPAATAAIINGGDMLGPLPSSAAERRTETKRWLDDVLSSVSVTPTGKVVVAASPSATPAAGPQIPVPLVDYRSAFRPRTTVGADGAVKSPDSRFLRALDASQPSAADGPQRHISSIDFRRMHGVRSPRSPYGRSAVSGDKESSDGATASARARGRRLQQQQQQQQRAVRVSSPAEGLPFEAYSTVRTKDPRIPSAWALAPPRDGFQCIPGKPMGRRVLSARSAAGSNSTDTDIGSAAGATAAADRTERSRLVEEVWLDEARRPYVKVKEIPCGAAAEAQRESMRRLSKPKPIYVRADAAE